MGEWIGERLRIYEAAATISCASQAHYKTLPYNSTLENLQQFESFILRRMSAVTTWMLGGHRVLEQLYFATIIKYLGRGIWRRGRITKRPC